MPSIHPKCCRLATCHPGLGEEKWVQGVAHVVNFRAVRTSAFGVPLHLVGDIRGWGMNRGTLSSAHSVHAVFCSRTMTCGRSTLHPVPPPAPFRPPFSATKTKTRRRNVKRSSGARIQTRLPGDGVRKRRVTRGGRELEGHAGKRSTRRAARRTRRTTGDVLAASGSVRGRDMTGPSRNYCIKGLGRLQG